MNIEQLQNEWEKDSRIDMSDLANESMRTLSLHSKYIREYTIAKIEMEKCEEDLKILKRYCWYKYNGLLESSELLQNDELFNLTLNKKDELNLFIESDSNYSKKNLQLKYLRERVTMLESILKIIASRNFTIKNAIDFIKIENGIN